MCVSEQCFNNSNLIVIVLLLILNVMPSLMVSPDQHREIWNSSQNSGDLFRSNSLQRNDTNEENKVVVILPSIYVDKPEASPELFLQYDAESAQSILQSIYQSITNSSQSDATPSITSFHHAETIATLKINMVGNVTSCDIVEIVNLEDSDRIISEISNSTNFPVHKIGFREMLSVVTACQAIDTVVSDAVSSNKDNSEIVNTLNDVTIATIASGIVPGTKWCGVGDIATNYEDLGQERETDKCCRAHDRCPNKIYPLSCRYGVVNWSLYTKSHCDCDSLLYECLKNSGSKIANLIGTAFFDYMQIQCIEEDLENVSSKEKTLLISDVKLQYSKI